MEHQPFRANHALRQDVELAVERDGLLALHLEIDFQMIVQVLADARQIVHHTNAGVLEHLGGPDA